MSSIMLPIFYNIHKVVDIKTNLSTAQRNVIVSLHLLCLWLIQFDPWHHSEPTVMTQSHRARRKPWEQPGMNPKQNKDSVIWIYAFWLFSNYPDRSNTQQVSQLSLIHAFFPQHECDHLILSVHSLEVAKYHNGTLHSFVMVDKILKIF